MSSSSSSGLGFSFDSAPNPFLQFAPASSSAPSLGDSIASFAAAFSTNNQFTTPPPVIPAVSSGFSSTSSNRFSQQSSSSNSKKVRKAEIAAAASNLDFELSQLNASPRTLLLAQLWPDDVVTQQYLTAVLHLSVSAAPTSSMVLTTPALVVLANCGARLAGSLLGRACQLATHIDAKHFHLFIETPLQQQSESGGWADSAPPLPRETVDRWWKQAKELCMESGINFPAVLENDSERFMCAFIVSHCLKLLIQAACTTARNPESPFLTIGSIEYASPPSIGNLFTRLRGGVCPKVEPMKFSQFSDGFSAGKCVNDPLWLLSSNVDCYQAENEAAIPILNGDCWYHHPQFIRRVAHQFVRRERRLSKLDRLRIQMGIRPMRSEYKLLPVSVVTLGRPSSAAELLSRVHLLVKDAADHEFPMTLDLEHWPSGGSQPSNGRDIHFLELPNHRRVCLKVQHSTISSSSSSSSILPKFQPHLTPKQQQVLDEIEQATARLRAAIAEFQTAAKKINTFGGTATQEMNRISAIASSASQPPPSAQFNDLDAQPPVTSLTVSQDPISLRAPQTAYTLMNQWRAHAFEKIIRLSLPWLDFQRWGASRYEEYQTADMRRQFQSCMIDAAMEENNMQLLPTDLLNIICGYSLIESLPYLTPDEQQQLTTSFEAKVLDSLLSSSSL